MIMAQTLEIVSFDSIKLLHPDEWVLIGNPELSEPDVEAAIVHQLLRGIVLFHSKDKRELAYKARSIKKKYDSTTLVYTGEIPKGRKFWL
jgi:hypothetical protein